MTSWNAPPFADIEIVCRVCIANALELQYRAVESRWFQTRIVVYMSPSSVQRHTQEVAYHPTSSGREGDYRAT